MSYGDRDVVMSSGGFMPRSPAPGVNKEELVQMGFVYLVMDKGGPDRVRFGRDDSAPTLSRGIQPENPLHVQE